MARNSSKTVTVGCKLPNGLVLEVGNKSVEINGANSSRVVGGHGITYDVDAEFFEAWLKAHADRDMVKGGFVFAHEKASSAKAEAADKESNKSHQHIDLCHRSIYLRQSDRILERFIW